jgi:hypothetical protein
VTSVNTDNIKIGYAIANASLDVPAYRRRFGYYLKQRHLSWEIANIKKPYDLVVVHHSADLTAWQHYSRSKIIFDYNDDYLSAFGPDFKSIGRGLAKFLFRHWSKLELDYRKAYKKMMARADAIVCCTDATEAQARQCCSNVHQILDMQSDPDWVNKKGYDTGTTFNLVWEGLPSFDGLKTLVPVLRTFQNKHNCALHLITALNHGKYLRDVVQINTKDEVASQLNLKRVFLYEWNPYLFSHIATACDLAIIPIDMRKPFWVSKPANKLVFFWRMAIPTLVDPTPAYSKIMNECGLDMVCHSPDEWIGKLDRFFLDKEARQTAGVQAQIFVDEHYSEKKLLARWDSVLASLL